MLLIFAGLCLARASRRLLPQVLCLGAESEQCRRVGGVAEQDSWCLRERLADRSLEGAARETSNAVGANSQ